VRRYVRERDVPLLAERPREGVARARTQPVPRRHLPPPGATSCGGAAAGQSAALGFETSEATLTYRWILGRGLLGNSIILDWLIDRDATHIGLSCSLIGLDLQTGPCCPTRDAFVFRIGKIFTELLLFSVRVLW
jgi:hypothetical protein